MENNNMNKPASQAMQYENMRVVPIRRFKPRTRTTRVLERKAFKSQTDAQVLRGVVKAFRELYTRHSVGFWFNVCVVTWIIVLVTSI